MTGTDITVRRLTLAPGEEIPWHRHGATDDLCVLLEGTLNVELREPQEVLRLAPGGSHRTPPGRPHRLSNAGGADCTFLLIQGVGTRDFQRLGDA
ncbi:cupin domain-containing protein [Sabulicella glaciei]|uniref:Cupin domain-containing protein n=1 Tax=Sabulicella glaciei TaxID=2984948 RepID=A0ABT3NZ02_9PROT|nr:cupin domain-containing protein [Roseococcus sp. MDT2-1-1]MCW8087396.1 cupin domain-containing protein [Roseococcus sp. MDT2-1-1]